MNHTTASSTDKRKESHASTNATGGNNGDVRFDLSLGIFNFMERGVIF